MTEQEWFACEDPRAMIFHCYTPALALRLFAVACCRRLSHLLVDPRSVALLDTIEEFARGRKSIEEWHAAIESAGDAVVALRGQSGSNYVEATPEVWAAETVVNAADCPATGAE